MACCFSNLGILRRWWLDWSYISYRASQVALVVKNLPAKADVGQEDPLEEGMATLSSNLAWRIPWTKEPGRLQSMGSQSGTRLKRLSMHPYLLQAGQEYLMYCFPPVNKFPFHTRDIHYLSFSYRLHSNLRLFFWEGTIAASKYLRESSGQGFFRRDWKISLKLSLLAYFSLLFSSPCFLLMPNQYKKEH